MEVSFTGFCLMQKMHFTIKQDIFTKTINSQILINMLKAIIAFKFSKITNSRI